MATYTVSFPDGKYPVDYDPSIADFEDYNPSIGELVDMSQATMSDPSSNTALDFTLVNGLVLKLTGTGFDFDDEGASAGKITKLAIFQGDGETLVSQLTLSKLSLVNFMEASTFYDPWAFQAWLMNRADTLNGSVGNDDLYGFGGNDVLNGKAGDDYMEGGEGKDEYNGGTGWDLLSFVDARDRPNALGPISIDFTKAKVTDQYGNVETFKSMEGVRGTHWGDHMKGSSHDEEFVGFGGRDVIDGKGGIDLVRYHRDEKFGGGEGVIVDLGAGTAVDGFGKTDRLTNIERVQGTQFDDELTGSNAANFLRGDEGNDTLAGGLGNDQLRGGDGLDVFIFNTALDEDNNVDDIQDFEASEDLIHLDITIFSALTGAGALSADAFLAVGAGDDLAATTADQRIIYDAVDGSLYYDADGSGAGEMTLFALVWPGLTVAEDNFFVIA